MAQLSTRFLMDTSELQSDYERIESGALSLPTVSAVKVSNEEGTTLFEIPVFLEENPQWTAPRF